MSAFEDFIHFLFAIPRFCPTSSTLKNSEQDTLSNSPLRVQIPDPRDSDTPTSSSSVSTCQTPNSSTSSISESSESSKSPLENSTSPVDNNNNNNTSSAHNNHSSTSNTSAENSIPTPPSPKNSSISHLLSSPNRVPLLPITADLPLTHNSRINKKSYRVVFWKWRFLANKSVFSYFRHFFAIFSHMRDFGYGAPRWGIFTTFSQNHPASSKSQHR